MLKRSLHYTEAPGNNFSPRKLNFSQIHHQTHSQTQKKKQGSGIYGEAAIMSERPLKLSGPTVYLYSKCVYIACYQLCRFYLPWYLFRSVCFQQCRCLSGKYISVYLFMCPSVQMFFWHVSICLFVYVSNSVSVYQACLYLSTCVCFHQYRFLFSMSMSFYLCMLPTVLIFIWNVCIYLSILRIFPAVQMLIWRTRVSI